MIIMRVLKGTSQIDNDKMGEDVAATRIQSVVRRKQAAKTVGSKKIEKAAEKAAVDKAKKELEAADKKFIEV